MFCAIESVTVGVGSLESSLQFFRDRLGMRVVNDTRASVGLVAAWRRPVHESVRLIDLASAAAVAASSASSGKRAKPVPASAKSLPPGRVRLAVYEDFVLTAATRDALGDKTIPPTSGPWAIEMSRASGDANRTGGDTNETRSADIGDANRGASKGAPGGEARGVGASNDAARGTDTSNSVTSDSSTARTPDGLQVLGANNSPATLSAIYISSNNFSTSTRFYTEALGLTAVESHTQIANASEQVAFGYGDASQPRIVLANFAASNSEQQQVATSMAVGQLGFNLITARCDDLDELQKRFEALAIKPITEPAHVGMPFGYPSRVMIVAGPDGELFEFDEIVV